jgi:carboxylesterase type B
VGAGEHRQLRRRRSAVFGESAGAFLVAALVASPEARGLFQRAIAEAAPGWASAWADDDAG